MQIIKGDAPLLHHDVSKRGPYRNISSRFRLGHVEVSKFWNNFARKVRNNLVDKPYRYELGPGQIDWTDSPSQKNVRAAVSAALEGVDVQAKIPSGFDTQILLCNGAAFHNDLPGWDNSLFLNWYVSGPERDFVLNGVGRVTLKPGDIILFDPSRPHGLLRPDMPKFLKSGWSKDAADVSIFLLADIALTEELDRLYGITRDTADAFEAKDSVDIEKLNIQQNTGNVVRPRPRRKS